MLKATSGQVEKLLRQLERTAESGIRQIFDEQRKYLSDCVREQYTEKLQGKEAVKRDTVEMIGRGEQELATRKREIEEAIGQMRQLRFETQNLLEGANGL